MKKSLAAKTSRKYIRMQCVKKKHCIISFRGMKYAFMKSARRIIEEIGVNKEQNYRREKKQWNCEVSKYLKEFIIFVRVKFRKLFLFLLNRLANAERIFRKRGTYSTSRTWTPFLLASILFSFSNRKRGKKILEIEL